MSLTQLQKRDEQRLRALRATYDRADGSGAVTVPFSPGELGLTEDDWKGVARYLDGRGLAQAEIYDGAVSLRLANAGIDEIESTIRHPEQQTNHFAPVVISIVNNYFVHSNVGAVQVDGSSNSAEVSLRTADD